MSQRNYVCADDIEDFGLPRETEKCDIFEIDFERQLRKEHTQNKSLPSHGPTGPYSALSIFTLISVVY